MAVTGMDRTEYVHKRRKKYLAQTLERFEENIEPHLPADQAGAVQDFKGLVRARLNALAVDCLDLMDLEDRAMVANAAGQELRDQISPIGR